MSKMSAFYKKTGPVSAIASIVLSVLFVVTAVQAATTIGSNISTDGTVSVTGLTMLGNASSTAFSVFNNAYFGATATSTFSSVGALTLAGALSGTSGSFSTTLGVTGLTSLGQASSTRFSVFDTAYFGGTATSTFNSAGALSVAGTLAVTGASTLTGASTHTGLASFGQASSTLFSNTGTAYFGGTATSTFNSAGALTVGTSGTAITQMRVYAATIDIAATAAAIGTTEQTFTVTGLTTADKVFVNGPAPTALCPVVHARVSATDTIALGIATLTAAACDPASATYNIVAIRN
jgi:hypothetical protein